jgi:hypothetical protein
MRSGQGLDLHHIDPAAMAGAADDCGHPEEP